MKTIKCIGVLTSGGDASGMNAAIRAVTRSAICNGFKVKGIYRGYEGLINGEVKELTTQDVSSVIQRGGTMLKTARSAEFQTVEGRKKAYDTMQREGIDALVIIGGNGSITGARIFAEEYDVPCIGLPGTIDNDLYGTDFTIGYDTALNTIVECVDKIRDTATSHDRIFFVEVMGRDAGFLAQNSAIASGAEAAIILKIVRMWINWRNLSGAVFVRQRIAVLLLFPRVRKTEVPCIMQSVSRKNILNMMCVLPF